MDKENEIEIEKEREKQFIKDLNNKENEDGYFTDEIIDKLLLENKELGIKIIKNNFKTIIDKTENKYLLYILSILLGIEELNEPIRKYFDAIVNRVGLENPEESTKFYKIFMKTFKENKQYIIDNIEEITKKTDISFLFNILPLIKGESEELDERLNNYLKENISDLCTMLLRQENYMEQEFNISYDEKEDTIKRYEKTLELMILELTKSENVRLIDIEYKDKGFYSRAYKIGDKILKIGVPKHKHYIPNHKRILQPLTRINFLGRDQKEIFCIEIEEEVDTEFTAEEMKEEKLYQIYKELRQDGIIWTDIRWDNLGKLKKSNIPMLHGKEMYVSPDSIGFDKELKGGKEDILQKGDIVIIDSDYIYKENSSHITFFEQSTKFERRYQQELLEKEMKENEKIEKDR